MSSLNPLRAGPVYDALQLGLEKHLAAVKSLVPAEIYQDREHWDASLRSQWMATLTRVLLRIRGMGHGGALLITPEASAAGLDVKYKIQYPRLTAALGRLGVAIILKTHADDMIWEEIANHELAVSASDHLDEEVARNEQEEAESEINGALWFIACLSRVDGLVLMNPDLSVEGFGTIITVEAELESVFAARDEFADPTRRVALSPDDFGTRHRSMMRYCMSYPGSVGFVISQDGDVRAMTKIVNDLVVWDSVRLTRVLSAHDDTESDVA